MLSIERLRISLPAGMQHRGTPIARRVASELAQLPVTQSVSIDRISLPPLHISSTNSDQQIATQIAKAIHAEVTDSNGQGDGGAL